MCCSIQDCSLSCSVSAYPYKKFLFEEEEEICNIVEQESSAYGPQVESGPQRDWPVNIRFIPHLTKGMCSASGALIASGPPTSCYSPHGELLFLTPISAQCLWSGWRGMMDCGTGPVATCGPCLQKTAALCSGACSKAFWDSTCYPKTGNDLLKNKKDASLK